MQQQKKGGVSNAVAYKTIASATGIPNKVYLGTAQEKFKK